MFSEKEVIKRWCNVRDYYAKSVKKIKAGKRSGSGRKKQKQYIYNDQLSFLKKIYTSRPTDESYSNDENCEDSEEEHDENSVTENNDVGSESPHVSESPPLETVSNSQPLERSEKKKSTSRKRRQPDEVELRMLKVLEGGKEQPNRHLSFFQGIIPALEGLDENQILEFQAGVIETLSKVRRQNQNTISSQHSAYYSRHPQYPMWPPTSVVEVGSNSPFSYQPPNQLQYANVSFHRPPPSPSSEHTPKRLQHPRTVTHSQPESESFHQKPPST